MNKKINKFLLFLFCFCTLIFTSCEKDDYTGDSTLIPSTSNASLSFDLPASITEDDVSYLYTVTITPAQVVNTVIPIRLGDATTATEGADFDYTHSITIPAYSTSATGELAIHGDCDVEDAETVELVIGNTKTPNVSLTQTTKAITLNSFVGDVALDVFVDWGGTVSYGGTDYDKCAEIDIDAYLFDSDGNNMLGYAGATAGCPEHLTLSGLASGNYDLMANLWYSGVPYDSVSMEIVSFPSIVSFEVGGCGRTATSEVLTQSEASAINNADADAYDDAGGYIGASVFKKIATIAVDGENFTWTIE